METRQMLLAITLVGMCISLFLPLGRLHRCRPSIKERLLRLSTTTPAGRRGHALRRWFRTCANIFREIRR